ncbi:GspE/PulE family protein [Pandoraea sp.]|uniref:GspE/PulE family protein n=1 Tax=Pandoraea sp. TaxID=1883445 RepID=UPI0012063076|nr:GspE/PulE family protein [Pandoraea sp.]TAL53582.1 MAG: type II/IV secretion system protein [Pandoraea sp.]TAM14875.1 MAG: type II/IV secretion system protein [Pandoraea sp.]
MNQTAALPPWLDAAAREGDFATTLRDALAAEPGRLAEVAALLGLADIAPEVVANATSDFEQVPLAEALTHQVLPLRIDGVAWLVLADPFSPAIRGWAQLRAQACAARLAMSLPGQVAHRLRQVESQERAIDRFKHDGTAEATDDAVPEISLTSIAKDDNVVVRLLNSTLFDALQSRASDIHLESIPGGMVVKYRIDGVLHHITQVGGADTAEQVISRIKVLGAMDIAERRVPQDGRFKASIQRRGVDFRVSIMPSIHGEDAVLRVLDKSQDQNIRLEALGFDDGTLARIRQLGRAPHGMVLVTGPTGSGKSTTLYAALSEINDGQAKLITIEDPVEYQLAGVLQIPVNDKKGLTFARGLRSILRHDPDIILVGEIRDGETAGIAVQAALTGHLVLSSVHANGVFSVLERFMYMDVEPASLLEALNGVVAQRLVRRVCDECARPALPDSETLAAWGLGLKRLGHGEFMAGRGCDACRHTGYRGRVAVAEVLKCSDAFKDAMLQRAPTRELRAIAQSDGFLPLREVALQTVRRGLTTLQEVQRVISVD